MNKRLFSALLAVLTLFCTLLTVSCNVSVKEYDVVCTSYVVYDWTLSLVAECGEEISVLHLGAEGQDVHNYEPTAADIMALSRATLFAHIGGESDEWVERVLVSANNPTLKRLDICREMEELIEEKCGGGHEQSEHEHSDHEHDFDEHVWFDFDLARESVALLSDALCEISPSNEGKIRENEKKLRDDITAIEGEYRTMLGGAELDTVVVADRYPFSYLFDALGIKAEAAYNGCSAESEASFEVVKRLSSTIDTLGISYVAVCENSRTDIARAVIQNTSSRDAEILVLDSMQSKKLSERGGGYAVSMRENLETLAVLLSAGR